MKARVIAIVVAMMILMTGCGIGVGQNGQELNTPTNEDGFSQELTEGSALEMQARAVLTEFYALLNRQQYQQAAELYGGSYEVLTGYNPTLANGENSGLLQAACEVNGFMCLEVMDLVMMAVDDQGMFTYKVQFANPDGSEFVLGPCCGATEEEMPPTSTFSVRVVCEENSSCLVMDLPPYAP